MSLGRGDQVNRNMIASIEGLGLLEKHSFDRLLPLFNVATNISTKIGYNKFCFVLLLRRVHVVEDQKHALRLFAVRVFRDEDAQKVRDILEPVRDAVLRRIFGGKFGAYVDRINHADGVVEDGLEELDGDSLPDFIAKSWRRKTSEEVVPLIRFPSVYVYIVDPLARFETLVCDDIAGRAKKLVLRDLFASRDNYEAILRKRISDPVFRDRERTVLAHLARRTSRSKKGVSLDTSVEIDSKLTCSSLLTNCPDYWNQRLSETASPSSEIPSLLERKEETNSEPQHQAFFDYTRQQRSRGHVGFLYASSDNRDRTESEYVAIWRHSLKSVDGRLFDEDRLDNEYPLTSPPSVSASFIAMAASCLHSVSLQVFLTRNKLNDIARFIAVANDPRVNRRELEVARNFASYLDYSSFASETLCRDRCPRLFAERIFVPLEWLDNEIVVDALNCWSHSRLDIRFCPLEPFDQPRYILLQGSDKTESMLRWQKHAEQVFEKCTVVTRSAPSRYVSPSDFAQFLRSRDNEEAVLPTACTSASSPFFDIFLKKRRLSDQTPSAKRIKSEPSVWAVSLDDKLYDETVEENALIRVYCANKCPRNAGSFARWKARGEEGNTKYIKALITHWQKEDEEERLGERQVKTSTFCERAFSDVQYNPYTAFLADHANSSPADSIEQLLFLQIFLKCASADFSILVNGNPGSGKTTIMNFLNDMLENHTLNLLPTNVLRERTKLRLERNGGGIDDPVVLTLSSFIKRNLRYNMSPDMYSRIIERYLAEQLERMSITVRPMSVDRFLNPLSSPVDTLLYPPLVQIDEYNLSNFAEMELVSQICRTLQCVRVCFGDFAQGAPIRGTNDNAELIALRATMMVQFMDNKRLLTTKSGTAVRLTELLSDPVWNWRGNNCEDGITQYVRKLIDRCLCQPLRSRIDHDRSTLASKVRERLGDEFLAERTIRLSSEAISEWFNSTVSLMQWYDEKPCRRHVHSLDTLTDLVSRLAPLPIPCVISRRNYESDRVNKLVSTAICSYVNRACSDLAVRATKKESRSSFLPSCFYVVTRRACIANEESVSFNSSSIKTSSAYDADDMEPNGMPSSDLVIDDDPWCSSLTLILGAVYRFIGKWPEVLSTDTLLRLIAFLPSESDASRKKKSPPQYFCDGSSPCDSECIQLRKQRQLIPDSAAPKTALRYATRGCGGTCRAPRLLMRRISTRDDEDRTIAVCESDFVVIGRCCFKLTRCNSVWTPNMYTLNCARNGMVLYGYPLVLNCGISSWRVQGETISRSDVYVDLRNMSRQQALVSLSRVRHNEQIRGVINLRFYGGSSDLAVADKDSDV